MHKLLDNHDYTDYSFVLGVSLCVLPINVNVKQTTFITLSGENT